MTTAERAAVADRVAADFAPDADPELREDVAALKLAGDIAAGNSGAVRQFLHELQHGLSPWQVDPWRLLHHVADLAIRQQERQKAATNPVSPRSAL